MAPLPKKKRSKSRKGMRVSHYRLAHVGHSRCPRCQSAKLPHRVCPSCGFYNDRNVLQREAPASEAGQA